MWRKHQGFTLLEILVALFVFTLIAMIMTHALHSILESESVTAERAERLRSLQLALLFFSHDLEQASNRSIINREGLEEVAFIGDTHKIIFTHNGVLNPQGQLVSSSLQRSEYILVDTQLQRQSWQVLDAVTDSKAATRLLLEGVSELKFEFLDSSGTYRNAWPPANDTKADALPIAVKISFHVAHWGNVSQVYIIPGKAFVTAS